MLEGGVGRSVADNHACFLDTRHRTHARTVVEKGVMGNLEEPRAEEPSVLIACRREIGLHQRVLRQVVCVALVATTEGEQKAAKCLLLTLYMGYELIACHNLFRKGGNLFLLSFYLLGQHLLANTIVYKESYADSQ